MKEDISKIMHKEDENMEYCMEHFQYSLQRSGHSDLDENIMNIIFLKALREQSLEILSVVRKGDIAKEGFDTIFKLCIKCS